MITIKYRDLKFVSILVLGMASILFFTGWLKSIIGIPLAILLLVAICVSRKSDDREIKIKVSNLLLIVVVVLIWTILTGQGGFFTQKNDNWVRNAIFRDVINNGWPVVFDGGKGLVYYIGHWLLPSLFGKIGVAVAGFETGYLIARIALLLWTSLFIVLTILNIAFKVNANNFKKFAILLTVFIFFSGMDAIGALNAPEIFAKHIEWWAFPFQFSSMTTQLGWVYNQSVPMWLAVSVLINEKDESNYALIGFLTLVTSPIPFIGLVIYLVAFAIVNMINAIKNKASKIFFKRVFSIQNIISLITILPVFALYYSSNVSTMNTTANNGGSIIVHTDEPLMTVLNYVLFVVFEFLILSMSLYKKKYKIEWIIMLASLFLIPIFKLGGEYDFCMRASIPALLILMVMLTEFFVNYYENKTKIKGKAELKDFKLKGLLIAIIFVIGSVTPMVEFGTSIRDYIVTHGESVYAQEKLESLDNLSVDRLGNFVATNIEEVPFYKYLARK